MQIISNVSMMFGEVPLPDRLFAAARAGFDGVEIQFPGIEETAALAQASRDSGMPISLINVDRGPGDSVGMACLPEARDAFRRAVDTCARQAERLAVRKVNVLAGRPAADADASACADVLRENLFHVAQVMQDIGVQTMVEPVNRTDVPGFFLSGLQSGLDAIAAVDHPNLHLQFDFYHMAITEPDLPAAIARAGGRIGHVQFADTPGRHEPGTGTTDFAAALAALAQAGYDDVVSAEYVPAGRTESGLGWLPSFREMLQ